MSFSFKFYITDNLLYTLPNASTQLWVYSTHIAPCKPGQRAMKWVLAYLTLGDGNNYNTLPAGSIKGDLRHWAYPFQAEQLFPSQKWDSSLYKPMTLVPSTFRLLWCTWLFWALVLLYSVVQCLPYDSHGMLSTQSSTCPDVSLTTEF